MYDAELVDDSIINHSVVMAAVVGHSWRVEPVRCYTHRALALECNQKYLYDIANVLIQ